MLDDESDHRHERADRLIELHAKLATAAAQIRVAFQLLSEAASVVGTSPDHAKSLAGLDQMLADASSQMEQITDRALTRVAATIRDEMCRPD